MKQRLFKSFFLNAMAVFLVCVTVFTVLLLLDMNDVNRQHLNAEASLAAAVLQSGGQGALETVSLEDSRIRWLGQDGAVLYDSAPDLRPLASHPAASAVAELHAAALCGGAGRGALGPAGHPGGQDRHRAPEPH